MLTVMIKCPITERTISTGIRLGGWGWNRKAKFFAYARCPLCDVDHEWSAEDVWLSEPMREVAKNAA